MELVTKITAEEAKKMHYENQKFKREEIKKGKRVTLYNGILVVIITWGMLLNWNVIVYAKGSKPIQQFPKDVINLATAWREIPKTIYNLGKDEGTITGLTLGPIKGTATMVGNISKGIWQSLNSDEDQKESKGLVFSYKF